MFPLQITRPSCRGTSNGASCPHAHAWRFRLRHAQLERDVELTAGQPVFHLQKAFDLARFEGNKQGPLADPRGSATLARYSKMSFVVVPASVMSLIWWLSPSL